MPDIPDGNALVDNLRGYIEQAAGLAFEYAEKVGWDKYYPMVSSDTGMPLTKEDLIKTYETLVRRMYEQLQRYLAEGYALHPTKTTMLVESYANFQGAVILTDRNPDFRLGILW